MLIRVILHPLASHFFRVEVDGLSVADREGDSALEVLTEALDTAALYLDCKEPDMLEFEVFLPDGTALSHSQICAFDESLEDR